MAASKYSLSPADARACIVFVPRSVVPRVAFADTSQRPASSGTKVPRYSPSFVTVHCSGTSVVLPDGDVTVASTCASLTSTNAGSTTSAESLIGSPGSTRSLSVMMLT